MKIQAHIIQFRFRSEREIEKAREHESNLEIEKERKNIKVIYGKDVKQLCMTIDIKAGSIDDFSACQKVSLSPSLGWTL